MAHIYKITNIINDNQYVGKTERKPEDRWREHLYHAKTDGPMVISKAIRKHGEKNFKFEVIEECSTAEMNSKEISKDKKIKNLYFLFGNANNILKNFQGKLILQNVKKLLTK